MTSKAKTVARAARRKLAKLKAAMVIRWALVCAFVLVVFTGWYAWDRFNAYQAQHLAERERVSESQSYLYDLKAQQDIAEWSYSMLGVGVVGFLASIVGIGFVYENLRQMRRQTLVTREVGEKQTRAYVFASSASVEVPESEGISLLARLPTFIFVTVENTGSTPATILAGKATLKIETGLANERIVSAELEQDSSIDALITDHPQRMRFIIPRDHFDIEEKATAQNAFAKIQQPQAKPSPENAFGLLSVSAKIKKVTCRGAITYFDVFGDQFSTEFHFEFFGFPKQGAVNMQPIWSGLHMFKKVKDRESE